MILYKTELALAELQSDKRSLNLRERRVLLFVNERRTLDEVRALLSFPESGELIYLLGKKGYLSSGAGKQPDESPASAMDEIMAQLRPLIAPIAASTLFTKPKTQQANVSPAMSRPAHGAPAPARTVMPAQAQILQDVGRPAQVREPAIDEEAKLAIKHIIIETSGEHLGIFSRELLDKTERAQDAAQLRACISQWHMAMQESRSGREKCLLWLNEVNELLHHGTALELKSA